MPFVSDPKKAIGNTQSKEQQELAALHEATLTRLESLNESLITETQTFRVKLEEEFQRKSKTLENEYKARETNLEADFESKSKSLEQSQNDLKAQRDALDDKSNTHARRQLRKDIIAEIKNRQTEFKLTEGTNKLRHPIAIAMVFLMIFFASFAAYSSYEFYNALNLTDAKILWIAAAKQVIYSFGLIATVLFYIRWRNSWFEQHSQAEFQLKKLELDMERASWVVETSLEWKDEKGTSMPEELLLSLSRNLFSDSDKSPEPLEHPSDQLASALLGSASLVKMKAGGAEIELDPKKLKKSKADN